ncbi:MAG: magnesium transporter CorA family protein [Candidatus Pacebacteria bacterium]|nr:magnesium transporter CorA family protein [Candidatus Paceibacterota bacterium]
MITHYFRTLKDSGLKVYEAPRAGTWTHVVSPTDEELQQLEKEFGLDDAILADSKDFFEVPRFEYADMLSYFFVRYPFDEKHEDIDTAPLLIVMGESFVLTIAQREVPFLQAFISGKKEMHTTQKTKLFLEFLRAMTASFERELVRMRKVVYRNRTRVRNIRAQDIQRLVSYEHKLNDSIAAIVPTNAWLKQLAAGSYIHMFNEDMELMEDLMIANSQLVDSSKSLLKTIQNVRSATEAILTQNLNTTIKLLTALTVILTIPTLISSFFGMNVPLPLMEHAYAFPMLVACTMLVMATVAYYFTKKRWF